MSEPLIHVRYSETGKWVVQREDREAPVSEHPTATAAEQAAMRQAADRGADVVIHDRYARVRFIRPRQTDRRPRRGG